MTPDPMVLLDLIGLRPVVVEWLEDEAVVVASCRAVLVSPQADLGRVADWALARAASQWAAGDPPA